jgi:hypothetical protein
MVEGLVAEEPTATSRTTKLGENKPTELPAALGIVTASPNVSAIAPRGATSRASRTTLEELLPNSSVEDRGSSGEMKREHLWDFMWVMLGVAIGAAPSALSHIYLHFWIGVAEHLSLKGLVEILITVTGAAIFLVLFLAVYSRK